MYLDNPLKAFEEPDIPQLLQCKEGQYFDAKRKQEPKDLARHLIAFANANLEGGLLMVGVTDNHREIVGLKTAYGENYRNEIARCQEYITYPVPNIKFIKVITAKNEEDEIALIYIPYSESQVSTNSKGEVFKRVGDESKQLSYEEIFEFRQTKGSDKPFETLPSIELTHVELDQGVLEDYVKRISGGHTVQEIELDRLLVNNDLAVHNNGIIQLTKAGLLLLSKNPTFELPGAFVRVLKYEGREVMSGSQQNLVQDEEFRGPIPLVAQRVQEYVRSQLRNFRYLGPDGKFLSVPELPEDAWFEGIVNALVHRSYSLVSASILIRIFDDRMEIISPGTYPPGINPDNFATNIQSRPRNATIMRFMKEIKYVQMQHEGTKRMIDEMQKAGLPPPRFSSYGKDPVVVTLYNDIDRRRAAQTSEDATITTANLFRLETQRITFDSPFPEENDPPPSVKELRDHIENAIAGNGWVVSSFTHDIAIDLSSRPLLEIKGLVSVYEAFKFNVRSFSSRVYLLIDFRVQVRNRATIKKISEIAPHILSQKMGRGFVKIESKWLPCFIKSIDSSKQKISLVINQDEEETFLEADFDQIIPDLGNNQLAELVRASGNRINLARERKTLSQLSPQERLSKIRKIVGDLKNRVFPTTVRSYRVELSIEPTKLLPPDFNPSSSLREPAISLGNNQLSQETAKGLTTFGAFEKPDEDIGLFLLSSSDKMPDLKKMVERLKTGSYQFQGFHQTFGSRLKIVGTHQVDDPKDYLAACRTILPTLPSGSRTIMIIYMPDMMGLWSRGNYRSPYYQVKHFLLENGIPSQGVDQDTLANFDWKDLNLALDIFAKAGYTPWVLDEGLPLADVFIGLSYSSIRIGGQQQRIMAYVCVFDNFGRWQYYIGNTKPIRFEQRDTELTSLITAAIENHSKKTALRHIHIHHGSKLKINTLKQIAGGIRTVVPESEINFLHINSDTPIRLFSTEPKYQNRVERGSLIRVANTKKFFLATTGQTELDTTQQLGTPKVVEAQLFHFGQDRPTDLTVYGQHVLSLTKLNWASTRSYSAIPITLLYASKIARFMNIFIQTEGGFVLHPSLETTPWFL